MYTSRGSRGYRGRGRGFRGGRGRGFGRGRGRGRGRGIGRGRGRGIGRGRGRGIGRGRGRGRNIVRMARVEVGQDSLLKKYETTKDNIKVVTRDELLKTNELEKKGFMEPGKVGKEITIATNFFKLGLKMDSLLQYNVKYLDLKGEDISQNVRPREGHDYIRLVKRAGKLEVRKPYIYDGRRTIVAFERIIPIQEIGTEPEVKLELPEKNVIVHITRSKEKLDIDVLKRRKMNLRATVVKKLLAGMGYWAIGRNNFHDDMSKQFNQQKLRVVLGFMHSIQRSRIGYIMNLDICYKPMMTTNLWDYMMCLKSQDMSDTKWKETVSLVLEKKFCYCRYRKNKIYYINQVDFSKSLSLQLKGTATVGSRQIFTEDEAVHGQYWERMTRGTEKLDPRQPLVRNVPASFRRKNPGEEPKDENCIFLPPQLLFLCGLTDEMKSNQKFIDNYLEFTKFSPDERAKRIFNIVKDKTEREKVKEYLTDYGIFQDSRMIQLKGRVLPKQTIIIKKNRVFEVEGKWDLKEGMFKAVDLINWQVVYPKKDFKANELKHFMKLFNIEMRKNFPEQKDKEGNLVPTSCYKEPQITGYEDHTEEAVVEKINPKVQIVLILLHTDHKDLYPGIKKKLSGDKKNPLLTQFVRTETISPVRVNKELKKEEGIKIAKESLRKYKICARKISIQIQCKLGGSPYTMKPGIGNRIMNVGIDSVRANRKRIGGFTCTTNYSGTRFFSTTFPMDEYEEVPLLVSQAFGKGMDRFKNGNKKRLYPSIVVFFRSGCSYRQFETVVNEEISAIKSVREKISKDTKIVYIAVMKKNHSRFFTKNENGKYVNPPCGTVIDHTILGNQNNEFYLSASPATKKTILPTKYIVLMNEAKLTADKIQVFAYKMTHLYYNHNGSVRVPNTCKLATKIARMCGRHVEGDANAIFSDKLWYL